MINHNEFTIGFVGTLSPWHGLSDLIRAFDILYNRNSNCRLVLSGDGPERLRLEENVMYLQESIPFLGKVPRELIPSLLASFDVGTAPSVSQSSFFVSPFVVDEFMAARLPIVVSPVAQLADMIDHGVNGIFCAPDDPISLGKALARVWNDPAKRNRLGQATRSDVVQHHSWDHVLARILQTVGMHPSSRSRVPEIAR